MTFTYAGYLELLNLLQANGYNIANYHNWKEYMKCAIMRHDVDNDMNQALAMAQTEYEYNIKSTYFVLLTSNFYNLYSDRNRKILNEIQDMGHMIGLHFDEMAYPKDVGSVDKIVKDIERELSILSEISATDISVFSYHRPTKEILDANIKIQGTLNSYGDIFFKEFKYLSDSRMNWREPILDIIRRTTYDRMQILTHPFWYHKEEKSMKEVLENFILGASMERYDDLDNNFTKLGEIVDRRCVGS